MVCPGGAIRGHLRWSWCGVRRQVMDLRVTDALSASLRIEETEKAMRGISQSAEPDGDCLLQLIVAVLRPASVEGVGARLQDEGDQHSQA
eukprot:3416202-Rhodomonas_salina.1